MEEAMKERWRAILTPARAPGERHKLRRHPDRRPLGAHEPAQQALGVAEPIELGRIEQADSTC